MCRWYDTEGPQKLIWHKGPQKLQHNMDPLSRTGEEYGMRTNVEKSKYVTEGVKSQWNKTI